MNLRQAFCPALVIATLMLCGCMSDRAAKELGEQIAAPFNVIAQQLSGAHDLGYATAAFARKNERWPKDYAELETFVQKSDGLLILGHYDRVDFAPRADDGLEILSVIQGRTNRTTFASKSAEATDPNQHMQPTPR
jgi:hypothetical protein